MKRNHIIGAVIVVLVVGGASFYAGSAYAKSQTPARGNFTQFSGGTGGFAGRTGAAGGRTGGGITAGQILSVGSGSITIQAAQGSSTEIVLLGSSAQILKTVAGSASDLTQGTNVVITGTPNSDGSMTATSVQIRPAGSNALILRAGGQ